ncbi:MAG TPA: hypothetical protein VFV05_26245 [Methylomirabilota bacterium]|nr:hypothetical protein [Methylomirabilota bacterium]
MQAVAGVFVRRADAERAVSTLAALGIPPERITLLTRESDARRVPTDEGEPPGIGKALGAIVGGATGVAVGVPLGAMVTLLVPGVGPVIASGLVGAALLGAGGAAVGATLEESLMNGLPRDELFVYEAALRRGHSVVLALVDDDDRAAAARGALAAAGAESIDAARERWWLGLRGAEQERYEDGAPAFERDEAVFRRGFEAASSGAARGRGWDESLDALRARHGRDVEAPAFRRGWERGRRHQEEIADGRSLRKSA